MFQSEDRCAALPDPSLPVAQQLELALSKVKEHVCTIGDTRASCRRLEEVHCSQSVRAAGVCVVCLPNEARLTPDSTRTQRLKEKEEALRRAEQNVLSRDRVINELRLRLPATASRERLLADEGGGDGRPALRLAHQTVKDLQGRLDKKEAVLRRYQEQLTRARQVR